MLLISDVPSDAVISSRALRVLYLESEWIRRGVKAIATARMHRFDLLLVDLDLPDMSGLDVLRTLGAEHPTLPCLALSDHPTISVATNARKSGALAVVEKPFRATDVIAAVNAVLGLHGTEPAARRGLPELLAANGHGPSSLVRLGRNGSGTVAERWASLMLSTIEVDGDPKTIQKWAQSLGMSRSVLYECCRLVHVPTHDARDFARVLRAICCSGDVWQPETVLDLSDTRTLKKLLMRAGFAEQPTTRTPAVHEFLAHQRWIAVDNPGLVALQKFLYGPGAQSSAAPG